MGRSAVPALRPPALRVQPTLLRAETAAFAVMATHRSRTAAFSATEPATDASMPQPADASRAKTQTLSTAEEGVPAKSVHISTRPTISARPATPAATPVQALLPPNAPRVSRMQCFRTPSASATPGTSDRTQQPALPARTPAGPAHQQMFAHLVRQMQTSLQEFAPRRSDTTSIQMVMLNSATHRAEDAQVRTPISALSAELARHLQQRLVLSPVTAHLSLGMPTPQTVSLVPTRASGASVL